MYHAQEKEDCFRNDNNYHTHTHSHTHNTHTQEPQVNIFTFLSYFKSLIKSNDANGRVK